jgi:hypothetical protein
MLELTNIVYAIVGGTSGLIITQIVSRLHHHMSGRNDIVKFSTAIKRHARNHRELEKLLYEHDNLNSIVVQVIDAAYIVVKGMDPVITVLRLYKPEEAHLFRNCLSHIGDPETLHALATRKKESHVETCECKEFSLRRRVENTWFRSTRGRDNSDEKIDEAMLEQAIALAKTRDQDVSHSGSCHIAFKLKTGNQENIVAIPTSTDFRKSFKKEYGTDDLALFGAKDLVDKVLNIRRRMAEA